MRRDNEILLEADIKAAFDGARSEIPAASPYLKTRVLAELRGRRSVGRKLRFWQLTGALTAMMGVAAVMMVSFGPSLRGPEFTADTGKPFVVRVELEDLGNRGVEYARVELPLGVQFYSEKFPELANQTNLEVAVNEGGLLPNIPFLIRAESSGTKQITVRFFDKNAHQIAIKTIPIHFKDGGRERRPS